MGQVTELVKQVNAGNPEAREQLFAAAYPTLRQHARARLFRGGRDTYLDTTALVHESFLRFAPSSTLGEEDRRSFFAYAARVMRSVIIDSVRRRRTGRRGADHVHLTLDTAVSDQIPGGEQEMIQVHDALLELEQVEPRLAKVVEMRYFGGYQDAEIAQALGVTDRTVRRDWDRARRLLMAALT